MKLSIKVALAVPVLVAASAAVVATQNGSIQLPNATQADGSTTLASGWKLTPAGRQLKLQGDFPLKLTFSPDGTQLVALTAGHHGHGLTLVDLQTEQIVKSVDLASDWGGLDWIGNDRLAVGGGQSPVKTVGYSREGFTKPTNISLGPAPADRARYTSGIAAVGKDLFVIDTNHDVLIRLRKSGENSKYTRSGDLKLGYRPYGIAKSPDGQLLAITNSGDNTLTIINAAQFAVVATVRLGDQPNEVVWAKDGRIFTANANSNTVSVVKNNQLIETIRTGLDAKALTGATPDAVAVSPDGKSLYIANADNNDIAVVDVSGSRSRVKGFIPTGWYPTSVAVTPDGKRLIVGNGKGINFSANAGFPDSPAGTDPRKRYPYIGNLLTGYISFVDVPTDSQLKGYTAQVRSNLPRPDLNVAENLKKEGALALRKIKHVLYIIRENRTYDQVFGDIAKGNGDPNLCLFGKSVTPNAHNLSDQFVLLDNTYCNGEVSQDGHQWCNAAYATNFTEKAWVTSYSGRGEADADERLTASPAGYLWDACKKKGLDYYSYGEFANFSSSPTSKPVFEGTKTLEGHASAEWHDVPGQDRDFQYTNVFAADLKKAEQTGKWHDYMVMSLGEDHTSGLRPGQFTPQACVGSNDLGVGKIIDAISHSKFWKDTAVFIIEDDAQDGPDHVDAHRTEALAISPYIRRGTVDSTHYTTASMIRTMELILGLKPMTQYDEYATPMWASFTTKADFTPYQALAAQTDLFARNPGAGPLAKASDALDWSEYDRADPDKLNRILWAAIKPGVPFPGPTRGIIVP